MRQRQVGVKDSRRFAAITLATRHLGGWRLGVTSGGLGPTLRRQVDPRQRTPPAARVASGSGHKPPHALQKKVAGSWPPARCNPFPCDPERDRVPHIELQGMTDAAAGVHRWARGRGSVAGGSAGAAGGCAGDRVSQFPLACLRRAVRGCVPPGARRDRLCRGAQSASSPFIWSWARRACQCRAQQ
jgi:hypothetical protein